MKMSESGIQRLTEATAHDLIQHFPLPIGLLDDAGSLRLMNHRFESAYGPEVLESAPLQALVRERASDWHPVVVPSRMHADVEINAQVVRVQGNLLLVFDDTSDAKLLRELDHLRGKITELERLSSIDRLTGAWNRAHFERVVASELDRSARSRQPVSLILLDIDHFKMVNDTYGHQTGDSVLCELVRVICASVRSVDALFRWGGEEFVVLASSAGYRAGATLAEKIRGGVEQHGFEGLGSVTISLGVAEYVATESAQIWFGRADEALYRAKKSGRNRVCVDARGNSDIWAAQSGPSVIRLEWQEAYECGEPTIDREHRELFDLANVLLDASFVSASCPEEFSAALERLLAHIVRHFADEEALLAQQGYKGIETHRCAHAGLLARARELQADVAAGKTTLGDLVEFLANTVVAQHLFKVDREFFPLFNKTTAPGGAFSAR